MCDAGHPASSKPAVLTLVVLLVFFLTGCGGDDAAATSPTAQPGVAETVTRAPAPPLSVEKRPANAVTATSRAPTTTTTAAPGFAAVIREIDEAIAARMALSWRTGCPVPLTDLRLVELAHFDMAGVVQIGELVVHEDQVDVMIAAFERLFELEYPIEQMRLVDEFDADDMMSMQANNTSAFNCRVVAGTSRWSEHAYGRAIDINPLINPWVRGTRVSPPEGAEFTDRAQDVPGLIQEGDGVVEAFADMGWHWGGHWQSSKDYQHFSANGR